MGEFTQEINGVVITFFSTASAVGKTLISTNMASELARQGKKICLVDFDLQFGDVSNYLQLMPQRTVYDLQQAMTLQGNTVRAEEYLTPYEYNNVVFYVLPAPQRLEEAYNIDVDKAITMIRKLQKVFDYVLVDTTSMFSQLNLALLDLSTIVSFLGIVDFIPTIKNMKIGAETLKKLNYDKNKIRLILNRSNAKTRISIDDVENLLGEPFYHILPNDFQAASRSIKEGIPLVLRSSGSELGEALRDLVARYTNRVYDDDVVDEDVPESWLARIFS
ncbi:MAG: pilus assembly protein CpaE [Selenomonas ruminantium]|jgi:pilus assembly protein CpaE|uniref:Pilus assembly protein CpaE n=1 Tax=Selenomonas ruminantium TaxID=971 RepID=A0A927WPQ4_SELRU|nr:AAA family ATPase [Selenomonas ruminantium]MBE6086125.1 pilus assembly protein CpaE [Selenomonas ruminantium]